MPGAARLGPWESKVRSPHSRPSPNAPEPVGAPQQLAPMGSGEELGVLGSKCLTPQECLLQLPFRRQLTMLLTSEELPSIRPGEDPTKNLDRMARNYNKEQFFNEGGEPWKALDATTREEACRCVQGFRNVPGACLNCRTTREEGPDSALQSVSFSLPA